MGFRNLGSGRQAWNIATLGRLETIKAVVSIVVEKIAYCVYV
jgi:hypothetical protein